jgi:hypothetical protein
MSPNLLLSALLLCAPLLRAPLLRAQSGPVPATPQPATSPSPDQGLRRFELGGQIADMRTVCSSNYGCIEPAFGLGPGAAINLNRHFSIDAMMNVTTASSTQDSGVEGGRGFEFLAGPRVETRARHYGFFVEAKPGLMHWDHVFKSFTPPSTITYGGRDLFVSTVGPGVEYSPGNRVHFRSEVSDLILRTGPGAWSNHLQASVGVYVGLGRPIAWQPPVYKSSDVHPFFDTPNVLLLSASTLAIAADGITTQRFIRRGAQENDPIARPLVKYGPSGQVAISVIEITGELMAMSGLHHIGQHWMERAFPACLASIHAYFAYDNLRAGYHPASAPTLP